MHVNKANRGRQKRPKKATERERDGGKTPKPDGGGAGAGACERDSGLRPRLGVLRTGAAPEMERGRGGAGEGRVEADGLEMEGLGTGESGRATEEREGWRGDDGEGPRLGKGNGRKPEGDGEN